MSVLSKLAVTAVLGLGAYAATKTFEHFALKNVVASGKEAIDKNYADNLDENGKLNFMWATMARVSVITQTMNIPFIGNRVYSELNAYIDELFTKNQAPQTETKE